MERRKLNAAPASGVWPAAVVRRDAPAAHASAAAHAPGGAASAAQQPAAQQPAANNVHATQPPQALSHRWRWYRYRWARQAPSPRPPPHPPAAVGGNRRHRERASVRTWNPQRPGSCARASRQRRFGGLIGSGEGDRAQLFRKNSGLLLCLPVATLSYYDTIARPRIPLNSN